MHIASITFYDPDCEVGGGTIPAFAFSEWASIYGHEPVTISGSIMPDLLNEYDALFFNTPPRIGQGFNADKLQRPFAVMIHDETDVFKYPTFPQMVQHPLCKVLVHIDHDGDYYKPYHHNRVAWHPCVRPRDLLYSRSPIAINWHHEPPAILYAARITPWKNAHLLKTFAQQYRLRHKIQGRVDNQEYAKLNKLQDCLSFGKPEYAGADIFWDVCGTHENHMAVHRMNLAAFEAIAHGLMPIVNPNAIPKALRGAFIECDPLRPDYAKLYSDIIAYRRHKQRMWDKMYACITNSYASFGNVANAIESILDNLGL